MTKPRPKKPASFAASKQNTKSEAVKKIVRVVRQHRLSYDAFIAVCQQVRLKLKMEKPKKERKLPELLSLSELKKFFKAVQKCGDTQHELMLKLMLYSAVRVSELVNIRVSDVDLDECKIFIDNGKGSKDRYILFPLDFRLALQTYIDAHPGNDFKLVASTAVRIRCSYTNGTDYTRKPGKRRTQHEQTDFGFRHINPARTRCVGISSRRLNPVSSLSTIQQVMQQYGNKNKPE